MLVTLRGKRTEKSTKISIVVVQELIPYMTLTYEFHPLLRYNKYPCNFLSVDTPMIVYMKYHEGKIFHAIELLKIGLRVSKEFVKNTKKKIDGL